MNTKEQLAPQKSEASAGLVKILIDDGYLKTPSIIEAFQKIDRVDFVPENLKDSVYENAALSIGHKQTISQPLVVAFMLELLELKPGEKVLEVGTGSGWKTALMANLVGENGKVISIERIAELHKFAKKNIAKYGFLKKYARKSSSSQRRFAVVELILGDGSKGYKEQLPYDKIIAGATAAVEIPEAWKEQLKIGGRIVAPVRNSIVVVDKITKDKFEQREYFGFSFVPLVSGKIKEN